MLLSLQGLNANKRCRPYGSLFRDPGRLRYVPVGMSTEATSPFILYCFLLSPTSQLVVLFFLKGFLALLS